MNRHRLFLAGLLTLTLAFGLWVSAVDLQPTLSSFTDGDIVSASDFNDLFALVDQNFSDAETAINDLEETKVDLAGDTMTGPLNIAFEGDGDDIGLLIKKTGGGPLLVALNADTSQGLQVGADGSLQIGTTGSPEITLDVDTGDAILSGTVRNEAGDALLPIAYGQIDYSAGNASVRNGTANVAGATYNSGLDRFEIDLAGINFDYRDYVTVATVHGSTASAQIASVSGDLLVYTFDASGAPTTADFAFVIYDPED
jgi:hypothetical protein